MESLQEKEQELEKQLKKLLTQLHSLLSYSDKKELSIDNYTIKIEEAKINEEKPKVAITCLEIPEYDLIEDILNLAESEDLNSEKMELNN